MSPSSSSACKALEIGIVGFGPFAQFLRKTVLKHGHPITATSRSDHSQTCSELGIPFFRDMERFWEVDHDVILFCSSILSLSQVIQSIPFNRLKKHPLFVDVLSVKEYPRNVLSHVLPEGCDLLCTHPMFGPESGKHGWKGLAVMYEKVRIRDEDVCRSLLDIFEKEGCRMVEMSCTEHDMFAARSQFLTHTIGRILSEMEIEPTPVDTKGFQTLLQLRDNTVKDSFDLYCGLVKHNRFAKEELDKLEIAFQRLKQKLSEKIDDK